MKFIIALITTVVSIFAYFLGKQSQRASSLKQHEADAADGQNIGHALGEAKRSQLEHIVTQQQLKKAKKKLKKLKKALVVLKPASVA